MRESDPHHIQLQNAISSQARPCKTVQYAKCIFTTSRPPNMFTIQLRRNTCKGDRYLRTCEGVALTRDKLFEEYRATELEINHRQRMDSLGALLHFRMQRLRDFFCPHLSHGGSPWVSHTHCHAHCHAHRHAHVPPGPAALWPRP